MIAAIGTDGGRPVVWGLGETVSEAISDAYETEPTWRSGGSATCEIDERIAARVLEGSIACDALGIEVKVDRNNRITRAAVLP